MCHEQAWSSFASLGNGNATRVAGGRSPTPSCVAAEQEVTRVDDVFGSQRCHANGRVACEQRDLYRFDERKYERLVKAGFDFEL